MNNSTKQFIDAVHVQFSHCKSGNMFPYIGEISDDDNISTLLSKVYNLGVKMGFKQGQESKINEIKSALELNDYE